MVFKATFNNISVISWRSVLLVEETGIPEENHLPVVSHWQTLSHNVVSNILRHERESNSQLPYDHDHDDPLQRYVTLLWRYYMLHVNQLYISVISSHLKYCWIMKWFHNLTLYLMQWQLTSKPSCREEVADLT